MDNGWSEWSRHVLSELSRLSKDIENVEETVFKTKEELVSHLSTIKTDIAMLKVKASVWGGLAGLIPALVTYLSSKN